MLDVTQANSVAAAAHQVVAVPAQHCNQPRRLVSLVCLARRSAVLRLHRLKVSAALQQVGSWVGRGGLDALVNNAGRAVTAPVEYLPLDVFRQQIEVNLTGTGPNSRRPLANSAVCH